ncbi:MAG: VOC family protein [Acidimicrobiia bacterium]|nr:VOC family protein [Acidimicrobiia bacterium]
MTRIANAQLWVDDQEESLDFYTKTLGWEVRSDVTVEEWNFRWLAVGPPEQPDLGVVLMPIPGPPMLDDDSAKNLADLMAKGMAGTIFLTTDDCQASYEELSGKGVEFVDLPNRQPYGIDASFRDPSGNHIRLTQETEWDHGLVEGDAG